MSRASEILEGLNEEKYPFPIVKVEIALNAEFLSKFLKHISDLQDAGEFDIVEVKKK